MEKYIPLILNIFFIIFTANTYASQISYSEITVSSISKLHCTVSPCPDPKDY